MMEYQYVTLFDKLFEHYGLNYNWYINCHHSEGVTFLRGLPGAGKTELAIKLAHFFSPDRMEVVELDQQFWVDGEYKFDPGRLVEAKRATLLKLHDKALDGPVVVSDTLGDIHALQAYIEALPEGTPYNVITLNKQCSVIKMDAMQYEWLKENFVEHHALIRQWRNKKELF